MEIRRHLEANGMKVLQRKMYDFFEKESILKLIFLRS